MIHAKLFGVLTTEKRIRGRKERKEKVILDVPVKFTLDSRWTSRGLPKAMACGANSLINTIRAD